MHSNPSTITRTLLFIALYGLTPGVSAIDYQYEEDPVESELIENATDLRSLANAAGAKHIPLLIEFSTPWCMYCEALEQQVLEPMLRNDDYADRVIIRKIEVNDSDRLRDFSGDLIPTSDFGTNMGIELYPTLVFYDANGNEVVERIVGITVLEFVPDRIDRSIRRALDVLRAPD